jgi:plastocyanin
VDRGMRTALVAVACGALVGIPALARAQQSPPSSGKFTAHDIDVSSGYWTANDGTDATLTVATGGKVTFTYPDGMSYHNVVFDDTSPKPASCDGLPPHFQAPPWTGSCTFTRADTYTFHCELHPDMKGTVVVADPPPGSTPTPLPGTSPTPTPVYGATPTPTATPTPQRTLKVTLPARQRGRHVRGSVQVQSAHTRLEVTISAKLTGRKAVRVGHWLKRSAPAGRVAFAVPLIAPARHTLARRHRLAVTVRVALTPPGGPTLNHATKATVRPG